MNPVFQRLMNEAARLTRAGQLQAATDRIRAALAGVGGAANDARQAPAAGAAYRGDEDLVVDVVARVLPQSAPDAPAQAGATAAEAAVGARARAPARESAGDAAAPMADRFIEGSFTHAAGQRDYKLYIPPEAGTRPLPLVVMLHGCTQNPDDFAAGTAMNAHARAQGFFVLYPAQSARANPQRCWNWFKHNHQQRGRGEPALLAAMTQALMATHRIDPQRVYVAGLSAGGAMAAILGETYPDIYAAVGVHSGLAAGAAADLPSALAAMQGGGPVPAAGASGMPTIVFHGDADATVHPGNAEQVVAASAGSAPPAEVHTLDGHGGARRRATRRRHRGADGRVLVEHWLVHGAAHAWSGGSAAGSYTDVNGPDASAEMLRFFFQHRRGAPH